MILILTQYKHGFWFWRGTNICSDSGAAHPCILFWFRHGTTTYSDLGTLIKSASKSLHWILSMQLWNTALSRCCIFEMCIFQWSAAGTHRYGTPMCFLACWMDATRSLSLRSVRLRREKRQAQLWEVEAGIMQTGQKFLHCKNGMIQMLESSSNAPAVCREKQNLRPGKQGKLVCSVKNMHGCWRMIQLISNFAQTYQQELRAKQAPDRRIRWQCPRLDITWQWIRIVATSLSSSADSRQYMIGWLSWIQEFF